jgi:ribonuclease Z
MTLSYRVLGAAGRDNALLVTIDTGQALSRLLFDCGDGCLNELPFAEVQAIDHLFFSHLHMDHVGGFDTFFRCTYNRTAKANHIWGPARTGEILQHRFQGFMWNLVADQQATWQVHDLDVDSVQTRRYELAEAFALATETGQDKRSDTMVSGPGFTVDALLMNHGTPSIAYVVRETPRLNIDTAKLAQLELRPGPWLQQVRGPRADQSQTVEVSGATRRVKELQDLLLTETAGESIAYLTDFLLDEAAMNRLAQVLQGVGTVVCECQYRESDRELAQRNYHMTTTLVATLAKRAGIGRLVLFHLSERYRPEEWREMLGEVQAIFRAAAFPGHWSLPS